MAEAERSLIAHKYWQQADERFDYFITGVTGAMCAYLVQTMTINPISFSPNSLELAGLAVLLISTYLGIKRIETAIGLHRSNFQMLHDQEVAAVARKDGLLDVAKYHDNHYKSVKDAADGRVIWLNRFTVWRNGALVCGVLLIVAAKVWAAYYFQT